MSVSEKTEELSPMKLDLDQYQRSKETVQIWPKRKLKIFILTEYRNLLTVAPNALKCKAIVQKNI
jgi:hypothetical protein